MDSLRRGGSIAVINRNANRLAANDEFPGSRDLLVDVGNWMMDYGLLDTAWSTWTAFSAY